VVSQLSECIINVACTLLPSISGCRRYSHVLTPEAMNLEPGYCLGRSQRSTFFVPNNDDVQGQPRIHASRTPEIPPPNL